MNGNLRASGQFPAPSSAARSAPAAGRSPDGSCRGPSPGSRQVSVKDIAIMGSHFRGMLASSSARVPFGLRSNRTR